MDINVEPWAPVVRCYECGSSRVFAVCHHCWRPACAKHVLVTPRWAEKLFGREGSGPGLQRVRASHCADCVHIGGGRAGTRSRWLRVGMAGSGLAVIGVVTIPLSWLAGLILLLIGSISAAWAYLQVRRATAQVRVGTPVPLHPKATELRLMEHLHGEITLGAQGDDYQTVLKPVKGEISLLLTFGRPDRERVLRRRKRRPTSDTPMRYCAGCLLLKGPSGIKASEQIGGPVVLLDGDTEKHLVFRAEDAPSSSTWSFARHYGMRAEPDITSGPVWITPSIVPESGRHVFELDIQWADLGPDKDKPLTLDVIDLLRLEFPVSWEIFTAGGFFSQPAIPRVRYASSCRKDANRLS